MTCRCPYVQTTKQLVGGGAGITVKLWWLLVLIIEWTKITHLQKLKEKRKKEGCAEGGRDNMVLS